jgi:hypothetical protein
MIRLATAEHLAASPLGHLVLCSLWPIALYNRIILPPNLPNNSVIWPLECAITS